MEQFGRWLWLGEIKRTEKELKLLVQCTCGSEIKKFVSRTTLKRGSSKSCGCLQRELAAVRAKKSFEGYHSRNRKKHPLYNIWNGMNQRCINENSIGWENYGGRGISICDQWHRSNPNGFYNFCNHMGDRPEGLQIDRIDNDGNYQPGNVRWVTVKENLENRRPLPKYRKTKMEEDHAVFGNWNFTGKIERRYDNRGISNRYCEVICTLCNETSFVRKQDLKNGKSTKCRSCASIESNKRLNGGLV